MSGSSVSKLLSRVHCQRSVRVSDQSVRVSFSGKSGSLSADIQCERSVRVSVSVQLGSVSAGSQC